ncbi:glycosyltransferase family 2 protein [Embleya sp. NPDC056575]|uniref:glycosyltransferase family 2 protein n=1 Tax=unclassified Embleya TaxID=2699296 RepID=UPI0036A26085
MSQRKADGPAPHTPLISVVVPCYNEGEVVVEAHRRISTVMRALDGYDHEIVFVDDGSRDHTWDVLTSLARTDNHVQLVQLTRNFGHQPGMMAGLREARGDAVVTLDADLQDPPELIPAMVERWGQGWPVVSGRRVARPGDTRFKVATAYVYYRLLKSLADHPIALDTGDFRLLDRSVVQTLTELSADPGFLRGLVGWAGFAETSIEYGRAPRSAGRSKYTLRKMASLSHRGVMTCTATPARLPTAVGVAWLGGVALTSAVRRRPMPVAAWTFGGEALLLGVLGEYLRLVHHETRGRPSYVVARRDRQHAVTPVTALAEPEEQAS